MTGTALVIGDVPEGMVRVLTAVGLSARRLTHPDPTQVASADLVVCGNEDQRSEIEQRVPAAAGKTVTASSPMRALSRLRPDPGASASTRRRLAVVGTDLKFITPLVTRFRRSGRFEVRIDEWPKLRAHDPATTAEVLDWAEVVICEWCGPNAVIASRSKRPDQRLVVRLHRTELSHPDWRDVDIDAVDAVVAVGPHYRWKILETTGWPPDKVVVVPNQVDELQLDRPKQPGARFHIGMIGAASSRKRLDLALDVIAELRRRDPRFTLFVKGHAPWGLKWVEDRPAERRFFAAVRHRLDDPAIGPGVVLDPAGPDVAAWLRGIGFVLSTSDDESFHLAPAEGMASGAVPVIRPWPGADGVYDPEWIVDGAQAMAHRITEIAVDENRWASTGRRAKGQVAGYGFDGVATRWIQLLTAG